MIPIILAICALFPGYYGLTHHLVLLTYISLAAAVMFFVIGSLASLGRHRR